MADRNWAGASVWTFPLGCKRLDTVSSPVIAFGPTSDIMLPYTFLRSLACLILLLFFHAGAVRGQEVPGEVASALGGICASGAFYANVAIDRIEMGEYSTKEEAISALGNLGGIAAGLRSSVEKLEASKPFFQGEDADYVRILIDVNVALAEKADSLDELIKARFNDSEVSSATAKFERKRTRVIDLLIQLGYPEEILVN